MAQRSREVRAATLAAAALIAQQVAGRATRDALFLASFGIGDLPAIMCAAAVLSMAAALAFSQALAAGRPARVLRGALAVSTALLLAEWALALVAPRAAAVAVYLHVAVFGATLVSGFWSLLSERFDPRSGRRAMGRIGTGASLGGVVGGALAWAASGWSTPRSTLAAAAALGALSLVFLRPLTAERGRESSPVAPTVPPDALAGLRMLHGVPYLRQLALLVALGALTETLLDYALSAEAASRLSDAQLGPFFGAFHGGVALAALLAQALLANRVLGSLGLAGAIALLPAATGLGAAAAALLPRLSTTAGLRAAQGALRHSLFRSGYELLFTPLTPARRRSTKAIIDVGFDKLGTAAGAALALALTAPGAPPATIYGLVVLSSLVALALCRRLHRGYVATLADSLRSGGLRLEADDVVDATTRHALSQVRQPARPRRPELPALAAAGPPQGSDSDLARLQEVLAGRSPCGLELVPKLIACLARDDTTSTQALGVLRGLAHRVTGQLADALLDPESPAAVRRLVPRALRACATRRSAEALVLGLLDPALEVRFECAAALNRITDRNPELALPADEIGAAALGELRGASAQGPSLELLFQLLTLLLPEREPLRIAARALRGDSALRGTALEYLEYVLPETLRGPLLAALGASGVHQAPLRSRQELVSELVGSGISPRPARLAAPGGAWP